MPSAISRELRRTGISARRGFHLLAKPIGPICNLDCAYCYYLKKEELYAGNRHWRMLDETLESFVKQYIAAQPNSPQIEFGWQGGEPTLLGVDFFARAIELQKKYARPYQKIINTIQTNGTLLDDQWGTFFKQNDFLVGISIDGPAELHDHYRYDKSGKPTHDKVMRGLDILKSHQVEFNVLCVVNRHNANHPQDIYDFLTASGANFIQFIPIVEHVGLGTVTDRTVTAEQYGQFLCAIYDRWIARDVGRVFIQLFDVALQAWCGTEPSLCIFARTCGGALAIEHNGDVYSCDHFVEPAHKLGNLNDVSLPVLVDSQKQAKFGLNKQDTLPQYCRTCDVRFVCNGGCPKDRFIRTPSGEPGLNYLCAAYQAFFRHIRPTMQQMADHVRNGLPANLVMKPQ